MKNKLLLYLGSVLFLANSYGQDLTVNTLLVGEGTIVPNTKLTVSGPVLISSQGTPLDQINEDLKDSYLLWVSEGIVSHDYAIAHRDDWSSTPDYVFDDHYQLRPITELEVYIRQNKHLPNVPGVEELHNKNYYEIHEMLMGQLKNIEELLLYTIQQEKRLQTQAKLIKDQEERLVRLEENSSKYSVSIKNNH